MDYLIFAVFLLLCSIFINSSILKLFSFRHWQDHMVNQLLQNCHKCTIYDFTVLIFGPEQAWTSFNPRLKDQRTLCWHWFVFINKFIQIRKSDEILCIAIQNHENKYARSFVLSNTEICIFHNIIWSYIPMKW